ncbi:extracellular solute-binding protein [Gracilibacillus sp. JCM 18860]|uniref:extracellular solute-binding protein n=1 Tax=Gracilibacillus sp. JCM 18860 TaxID=1306159 RepID=UPI000AC1FFAF
MKRKLWLSVVFTVLFIFLIACSNDDTTNQADNNDDNQSEDVAVNKEGYPIVEEEITLSLMAPGTGLAEWEDMPTLQQYSEKTNINFEYDTPPLSDFQTKLNLAFASGDIADIIFGAGTADLTPGMEVDYGEQGVLIPLEDLIDEYAPKFQSTYGGKSRNRKIDNHNRWAYLCFASNQSTSHSSLASRPPHVV